MSNTEIQGTAFGLNEKHRSDGSELVPAEVQANARHNDAPAVDDPAATSYTVDDEGLLNNYAIEPEVYPAAYPSPPQQRKYILMGAGAALFVGVLILISFSIS
jgi:hypothetical protein